MANPTNSSPMKIKKAFPLITEKWKIDGGVAFGIVPKTLWSKFYEADEQNLIPMVNRCLLLETNDRLILINTGFGNKRDEKYYQYKYFTDRYHLRDLLCHLGYKVTDVTDVIFTHLHDDHCGGAVEKVEEELHPVFPKAKYWVSQRQLYHFFFSNTREKATFFEDNLLPLLKKEMLRVIHPYDKEVAGFTFMITDGHTPGQLLPIFTWNEKTYLYASDFIPSIAHIQPVWCAAADLNPLLAMQEKETFLLKALTTNTLLFFEHDALHECCSISKNEKGFAALEEKF